MADIRGINLAMQTPFDPAGNLDFKRYEELIDIYLEAGVHGFVLSAGTGQHAYITEAECAQMFQLGARRIAGRATVICQTSALNLDEVIRRTKAAEDAGADAAMILPPYFEGPTHDDGIFAFYERIDRAAGIDIVGYNIPAATKIELTPALFTRLCRLAHFRYIKDSCNDLGKQQALIAAGAAAGGKVLNGADPIAPFSFIAGCAGAIWGGVNFMPREAVRLWTLVQDGKYAEAMALWARMFPASAFCWYGDYNPAVKAACRIMGYEGGTLRAPVCELPPAAVAELEAALAPLKALRQEARAAAQ
jgi:4-hydroxy-tetrahydrodipicolinate synthase